MSFGYRISIVVNLALVAVIALLLRQHRPAAKAAAPRPAKAAVAAATSETAAPAPAVTPKAAGAKLSPDAVAELERLGLSRDSIVDALIDDHTFRYDKAVRAVEKKYAPKPVPRRERIEMARKAEAERTRELKQALGEEGYLAWDKDRTLRMLNMGGVPLDPHEADEAYRLQREFDEKNKALQMAKEDGVTDEADMNALYEQAQKQLDQQLEGLLGKDRVAAMRGSPDPIADVTRRFEYLSPTPDQAKAVLQAEGDLHAREAALVQRMKDSPADPANLTADLKGLTDAREESLRQIFGADNYDAMKMQNDSTYQTLQKYADAWNLNDQQIQPVYQALSAFHDEADRTRMAAEMSQAAGHSVNWHQINAGIEQARQQTEAGLITLIGADRVRRLQQNGLLVTH